MAKCPNCGSTDVEENCNGVLVAGGYLVGAAGVLASGAVGHAFGHTTGHAAAHAAWHGTQELIKQIPWSRCRKCGRRF